MDPIHASHQAAGLFQDWTAWHWTGLSLGTVVTLFVMVWRFLPQSLRDWLKQAFWDRFFGKGDKAGEKTITEALFQEHVRAEDTIRTTILHAIDQNGKIIQDASIQVADMAKEMREESRLTRLALDEHRREADEKMGQIHDRITAMSEKSIALEATVQAYIDIAKRQAS